MKKEVQALEREKLRFSNLKKALLTFTKMMNFVSNTGLRSVKEEINQ